MKINWITKQEDIDFFLNLKEEDLTVSYIIQLFGKIGNKRRYNCTDYIKIPKNSYGNNKEFVTTLGIWVFNKLAVQPKLYDFLKYINKEINGSVYKDLNKKLSYGYMEDKITNEQMKDFLLKFEILMSLVSVLSANDTEAMLTINEKISKKKLQLINQHKDELQKGNEIISEQIEKELLAYCKELLKDDDSLEVYNSGARGSFGNNFKNMYVIKGAILNPDTGKDFNIAKSSYLEGISKEEFFIFANSLAGGPYSRAKKTEIGGYWEKLFLSAFQHVVLGKKDSDCGTKRFVTTTLTKSNISDWMYSYIIEGTNLVELNSDNMDKYVGKTVKFRYSSMCESKDNICNKCMGNQFYKLGIVNVGMLTPKAASRLKQLSMKSFHDGSVVTTVMDVAKAFSMNN